MSSKGARRGYKRETIFVELVNNDKVFRTNLEKILFQLNIFNGKINLAEDVKNRGKSDVRIHLENNLGITSELGFSLKSAEANFNQLDRRWLYQWSDILNMPSEIRDMIQSSIDRKRVDSRARFILPEQESVILTYLESEKDRIFKELFTKQDETLKVFVVYDEIESKWYISKIEDIIDNLKSESFTTTNRGVVRIGDSLSLQRKGGDGNIKNPPKSDPRHPSNHLQFKIKPLTIIKKVETIELKE